MLSPETLNRVSHSYRRGYYSGYKLEVKTNLPILHTESGIPMKPFSDFDYEEGYKSGLNDRYWVDFENLDRKKFMSFYLCAKIK